MSTREILRRAKPKVHPCDICSGTVHVRALSGAGRAAYLALAAKHEPGLPPSHEIVALALCEEDGILSYDYANPRDITELSEVDGDDLQKIVAKIFEVSGLTKEALETAEKKSEASQN